MTNINEKQLMENIWDILLKNDQYFSQAQFVDKYRDYFVEIDCASGVIRLADDNNEYELKLQKIS